jgi:hypothetical protein
MQAATLVEALGAARDYDARPLVAACIAAIGELARDAGREPPAGTSPDEAAEVARFLTRPPSDE